MKVIEELDKQISEYEFKQKESWKNYNRNLNDDKKAKIAQLHLTEFNNYFAQINMLLTKKAVLQKTLSEAQTALNEKKIANLEQDFVGSVHHATNDLNRLQKKNSKRREEIMAGNFNVSNYRQKVL